MRELTYPHPAQHVAPEALGEIDEPRGFTLTNATTHDNGVATMRYRRPLTNEGR